ncbi:MAG: hypothetical protein J0H96_14215 [Microbacterium ginsengisoli]|uniref:hypothetical protein n=1 Tax=Microbacterium sp. SCN 71-21 TaxID=1660116 RepID=UPI000869B718|nr:hypothetical protein [Microbacterium sp. SCN 71-21]MBN9209790.1 hypothetical protein [Microbacterium ginsengisoli]ODU75153.1 MAG: hypothetical protein ABT08_10435 [Microbacterium sp. SCN 71-21]
MDAVRSPSWIKVPSVVLITLFGACLVVIGAYFALLRPSMLPEDERFVGASMSELQMVAPAIGAWLSRVFLVLGGYIAATGVLMVYVAQSGIRRRSRAAGVIVAISGALSIGTMAVVNLVIDSDFKWPLLALAAVWTAGQAFFWSKK